jgi:hypothetical protein
VLLLLLGLALLWQGLQWYDDHLRRLSRGPRVAEPSRQTPVPATPTPEPTPTPAPTPPPPTPEEIAALATSDQATQLDAVNVLLHRQMTPELAVALSGVRPLHAWAEEGLACLRARAGGAEGIDVAIRELARQDAAWPGKVDHALCLVRALSARASEQPDRIRDALIPYAMAIPARLRGAALEGLARVPVREMPPKLREAAAEAMSASMPVAAALALGLDEETAPDVVDEFLQSGEASARSTIRAHLVSSPKPAAASFIAERLVRDPRDGDLVRLAKARSEKHGDVAPALADVALDETRELHERQAALELAGSLGDPALVARLEPLTAAPDGNLRAYAEAAVAALRAHR